MTFPEHLVNLQLTFYSNEVKEGFVLIVSGQVMSIPINETIITLQLEEKEAFHRCLKYFEETLYREWEKMVLFHSKELE